MKRVLILLSFLFLIVCWQSDAQRRMPPADRPGGGQRGERLERFRKMRLIEVLNLNEDEAVRFFAKQNAHEDKVHDLMKARNDALDNLDAAIKDNKDPQDLQQLMDNALDFDKKLFAERERYHKELRDSLTSLQFAKFLVFERNFGRQVRDALEEMRHDRSGGMDQ
jgi:hypothetical protein